jgi:putative MATE family efflux protein
MNQSLGTEIALPKAELPSSSRFATKWKDLREAIVGTQQDFTEGSIGRAVMLLAIPMVLEMAMESLFAVVDVFFVARLGADAVASVGITEAVLTLVFAVAWGMSMSTTAMVARRIGEKDSNGAAIAAVQAILIGVAISLPIGIVGVIFAPQLLELMGASPSIVAIGSGYTAWIMGGNGTVQLLFLINAIFRGAGDAVHAMRALWIANFFDIVLDPCFIFGWGPFPEMSVTGGAVATNIGREHRCSISSSCCARRSRLQIKREHLRLNTEVMMRLLRVSFGGIVQVWWQRRVGCCWFASWPKFGSAALAGYTIALRIIVFAILPSWGMGGAAATMVGQNLGAQNPIAPNARFGSPVSATWCFSVCHHHFHYFRRAAGAHFHERSGSRGAWRRLLAVHQLWLHLLCLRHGRCAGVQWRGRHDDADDHQFVLLLAVPNSAGVCVGDAIGPRRTRGVSRHHHFGIDDCGGRCSGFPERAVEGKQNLTSAFFKYEPQNCRFFSNTRE